MKASETQVGGTHYKDMGEFQPWDVLQHWLTPEEYRGYQKGVVIAYLARERGKGGDQDIRKAAHHLNKLVEVLDAAEAQHAATAPVVFPGQPEYSPDEVALAFGMLSVYWRTGSPNIPFNHHGDIIAYRVVRPA